MSEQKSVIFNLTEPLEYSNTKTGSKDRTAQIEMFAPTYSTAKFTYKLAQYFMKAVLGARRNLTEEDKEVEEDKEEMTVSEVKAVFFASDIQFEKVVDTFVYSANKVCFIDDDKKISLTSHLISKLSFNDMTDMVCFYIANFIVPFALSMK